MTAERHAEPLDKVPISVTAVSPTTLAVMGADMPRSLDFAVPSLAIANAPSGIVSNYIRGVGTNAANVGDEPSVATYIDGFYLPVAWMEVLSFPDVERVEVLEGPQGTLFGRNASGGVIQVVTKDPSFSPQLNVGLDYSSFQTVTGSAYGSAAITPTLAFALSGQVRNQGEGWGRNLITGAEVDKTNDGLARGKLLFRPSDALTSVLALDYIGMRTDIGMVQSGLPGGLLPINVPVSGSIYDSQANGATGQVVHQLGIESTTRYQLKPVLITNLTQYREFHQDFNEDADHGPINLVEAVWRRRDRLLTEELQAASYSSSIIQWVSGLYYMNYTSGYDNSHEQGSALGGDTIGVYPSQQTISSALYSQGTIQVLPKTRITLGARYTRERKYYTYGQDVNGGPMTVGSGIFRESKPTWRFAIDQTLNDQAMAYVSYNRGYKSGGFNTGNVFPDAQTPVKSETVDAYELGLKSEFFSRRLGLDIAGFYNDFRNMQVQSLVEEANGVTTSILTNAAVAKIKGIEVALRARPMAQLSLSVDVNYLNGTYTSYPGVPMYVSNGNGTYSTVLGNASGLGIVMAPKWAGTAAAEYRFQLPWGVLSASPSIHYNSMIAFTPLHQFVEGGYGIVNFSILYVPNASRFSVRLYSTNLTNKAYYVSENVSTLVATGVPGEPRVFGISLNYMY